MGGESVGLAQRRRPHAADAEPFLGRWDPVVVAPALSALLRQPVSPAQVRRRAVALGLLREPPAGEPCELSARHLSRLFLAGYRLPAHVELGTPASLRAHVHDRQTVFVRLDPRELSLGFTQPLGLYRVFQLPPAAANGFGAVMCSLDSGEAGPFELPPAVFLLAWAAAGNLLIAAASNWDDLPREGSRFFGGSLGKDAVLHWDTAECDTSADGEILR